ncbi:serine--tRNA ligase [Patescibacteria group bacterium]|nr:serine--tRNA ligase [Patescibacteria group bacterium]
MIDLKDLRENQELYAKGFAKKGVEADIPRVLKLDEEYRGVLQKVEEFRAEKNSVSKQIPNLPPGQRQSKIAEMKTLDGKLDEAEKELNKFFVQLKELTDQIPNPPHESVPEGKDENENAVVRTVGEKPVFDFKPKDHLELGALLDLIDTETAAKVSGARFYYLKNEAVQLEFALIQWLLQKYISKGFTPVTVPMLVKEDMMYATGFFPADRNEIYCVNSNDDNLFLVGTSEVPLSGLHMFKATKADELPKRYVGFSSCFRREAGSYGKDTRGILRVHQFDKMEMFSFCHPDKSWEEHEFLLSIEEEILQELKLPYQVVNICGGDLGAPAAKKYDCEVWIPTQENYRELTSCSNCTDFQARRGGIRFKDENGTHFMHTLNGTAMASTRTIIALLENNQRKDGTVVVPEVLWPFMGGVKEIKPKP